MQFRPSLDEVRALRDQGNLCPIYAEILADLETPVSAFLKVARGPWSFLLESVEGGQHLARYSFIGAEPYMTLRFADGVAYAIQGGYKQTLRYADPLTVLGSHLAEYRPVRLPDLPRFVGGAVGYLSYETVGCFERLPRPDERGYVMPDGMWQFVDTLLAFDHLKHKIKVISHVHLDADDLAAEYARAVGRIDGLIARLAQGSGIRDQGSGRASLTPDTRPLTPTSNVSQDEYERRVLKAKEYIAAGDIFQVVPSQRFSRPVGSDPFTIYRALRTINPSPYMFYLRTPEGDLVGASPELLVRVEDGVVTTHPIAGTRWRGADEAEDRALAEELLADEKERAEHLMLVDLGRNDIGRVSRPGTVSVPNFMFVEKFSHVMHLVSHVTGRLREDIKDGVAYVQAGGGVVADSDPAAEYRESCNKAAALLRAIEEAEGLTG